MGLQALEAAMMGTWYYWRRGLAGCGTWWTRGFAGVAGEWCLACSVEWPPGLPGTAHSRFSVPRYYYGCTQ